MYYRYFGLQEAPFSIAPNPQYLFMSEYHRDALAHLLYGVGAGGGFILLTGEVGTGKTTVTRCLLEQIPDNTDIAIILNPALNSIELLATLCDELGIKSGDSSRNLKDLTDKLHQYLLDNHARGRNTVLLIDEAQQLKTEVLEQVRLLTNLETNTKKLLQIILVGQPELNAVLAKTELRQLNQRITARYQIQPLSLQETRSYIRHRLQVAGLPANQELFPDKIVKGIYQKTRGLPRLINILCDRILLGTYGQNKTRVDPAIFRQATAEVLGEGELHGRSSYTTIVIAALVVFLVSTAAIFQPWKVGTTAGEPTTASKAPVPEEALSRGPGNPADVQAAELEQMQPEISAAPWVESQQHALTELLAALALETDVSIADCLGNRSKIRCVQENAKTWQQLKSYNRPAILTLATKAKMTTYAALKGISESEAILIADGGEQTLSLTELGERWTGEFMFLWQPPPRFDGPVSLWNTGEVVAWIAAQFAQLDGQDTPLTTDIYNKALQKRVQLFQQRHGLAADGVVGRNTLLRLNEQTGTALTLDAGGAQVSRGAG